MAYIENKVLSDNEKILLRPTISKVPLFWKWVWGVLGFWLLLIPTISAIKKTISYKTTEYAVTDKKVIAKHGLVSVVSNETNLDKIENIVLNQSFWGRVFHYGTIVIQGANRNHVYLQDLKDYTEVKKYIDDLINV